MGAPSDSTSSMYVDRTIGSFSVSTSHQTLACVFTENTMDADLVACICFVFVFYQRVCWQIFASGDHYLLRGSLDLFDDQHSISTILLINSTTDFHWHVAGCVICECLSPFVDSDFIGQ